MESVFHGFFEIKLKKKLRIFRQNGRSQFFTDFLKQKSQKLRIFRHNGWSQFFTDFLKIKISNYLLITIFLWFEVGFVVSKTSSLDASNLDFLPLRPLGVKPFGKAGGSNFF